MANFSPSHVVVIGAGWAGWGATKALCEAGVRVTLIDGIADPTGRTPLTTKSGKPFEAGTRGFWKDYPNINALTKELKLGTIFTEFTPSAFWSPEGLEATAPVFGNAPTWPSPLGQMAATFSNFKRLPLEDRLSIAGLFYTILDLYRNEEVFKQYDQLSAIELFQKLGISKRLIDDFLRPTLLVGLFKPPEELSAAITMELLYYYALAHQDSFDVRWINSGSIAEQLFAPLSEYLRANHDLHVLGGTRVTTLHFDAELQRISAVDIKTLAKEPDTTSQSKRISDVDAVVLAVGAKGMKAIMSESPTCQEATPELVTAGSLDAIDVVSVRLWLDRYIPIPYPANVFSRFPSLQGAGGTFFMLDQLQTKAEQALWGDNTPQGSVLACDFYNAAMIASLDDQAIIQLLMNQLLPIADRRFGKAEVLDHEVRRYPQCVSLFSPGSFEKRPPLETSVDSIVCAGDWVRMGDREHGAKGLCQERAYVCGLEAGNSLLRRGIVHGDARRKSIDDLQHTVIPIRTDEPQVVLGRALNKSVMEQLNQIGIELPWFQRRPSTTTGTK